MKASEILDNDIKGDNWAHAYLFIGGNAENNKELFEKIVKSRHCLAYDVSYLAATGESGKKGEIKAEDVRNLIHDISLSPHGIIRIAVLEGVEHLNLSSANILLKTLEEPPKHAMVVMFAGSERILPTIKSRCRIIRLNCGYETTDQENIDISFIGGTFLEITKQIEKIVKDQKTNTFLDAVERNLRQEMLKEKKLVTVKLLKKVQLIRNDIKNNANARLSLETLCLMIREIKR